MTSLVFFLEEISAREMLQGMLPRILPEDVSPSYVVFEGKQDLEKRLPMRMKGWLTPDTLFVVMRDKDGADCREVKRRLVAKCRDAGKSNALVRIACHELESFYLGDLSAVAKAFGLSNSSLKQNKAKYRNPDSLANAKEELMKIAPEYQPRSGSRALGHVMDIEDNRSKSFNMMVSGIRKLVGVNG